MLLHTFATASPIIAVKPVFASASATPITPAIIRITGAPMLSLTSLKLSTFIIKTNAAASPGIT